MKPSLTDKQGAPISAATSHKSSDKIREKNLKQREGKRGGGQTTLDKKENLQAYTKHIQGEDKP